MNRIGMALVPLLLGLLTACSTSPDIGVLDLTTGTMRHPRFGALRQVVVATDSAAGTFTTMTRENLVPVLRTFDKTCAIIAERRIPLFARDHCDHSFYAVSPDVKRLAYASGQPADLRLMNVDSGQSELLLERFTESHCELTYLQWIGESSLLAVRRQYPGTTRTTNEITLIDTLTRTCKPLANPGEPTSFDYALTADRTRFAFCDGNKRYSTAGVIKILNLVDGRQEAQVGAGKEWMHAPRWNGDGTELAYVEGRSLNVWNRASGSVRTLATFPERFICYRIAMGDGIVGYNGGTASSSHEVLVLLDATTGRELRRVRAAFNGRIVPLDGQTAVCEIGY